MTTYLYWIRYSNHTDPFTQGYIGISNNPDFRFQYGHSKHGRADIIEHIKNGATMSVISEWPDIDSALLDEKRYRPHRNIGWNISQGGAHAGWGSEMSRKPEFPSKVSKGMKEWWATPDGEDKKHRLRKLAKERRFWGKESWTNESHVKMSEAQKRIWSDPDHKKSRSRAISDSLKGRRLSPEHRAINKTIQNRPMSCLFCRKETKIAALARFHGPNKCDK